jgi:hypothetical protein
MLGDCHERSPWRVSRSLLSSTALVMAESAARQNTFNTSDRCFAVDEQLRQTHLDFALKERVDASCCWACGEKEGRKVRQGTGLQQSSLHVALSSPLIPIRFLPTSTQRQPIHTTASQTPRHPRITARHGCRPDSAALTMLGHTQPPRMRSCRCPARHCRPALPLERRAQP